MTQTESNEKWREKTGKISRTITVYASDIAIKEQHNFIHAEIYAAGIKYLLENNQKSQQS